MWILRPYIPPKPLSVGLPYELIHTLGFGVNILVSFLEKLSAAVIEGRDSVPSPPTELCHICERHVPTWWFERHSELCLVEHKTQSELDSAHENLIDQRNIITHLLALLDSRTTFGQLSDLNSASPILNLPPSLLSSSSISSLSSQTSSNSSISSTPKLEYRGIEIPFASHSPASETSSPPRSPRIGSTIPPVSKRMLVKSFNIPKRSPIKLMELLIELCDMAVDINSPEIRSQNLADGRIHSPQSESKIHRVLNWVNPNVDDPALSLLCEDTVKYARQKVEAVVRLGDTVTYFETIRHESESMVAAVIEDTVEKATMQRDNNQFDNIEDEEGEAKDYDNVNDDTDIDDNSSLFSESYLHSDALPLASRIPSSLRREQSFGSDIGDPRGTRSMTPKSLLTDSMPFPNSSKLKTDSSKFEPSPAAIEQSGSLDFRLTDLDLNPRLQKKKSISNLSIYSSSSAGWTSLQRNRIYSSADISQSPSSPLSSPLIFPHETAYSESLNHRRQSSVNSDFSRAPVSPLLTSTVFPSKPAAPSIKDYEIITPISKGAFGSVYLAKKRNTGEYFAIKVLKKADMIAKNQVMNVRAERAIMMSQSESPFVAKLYFTFQSKNYLYLVMEYLNGGDCAALVKVLGGLPEDWAKKYIAEVILGVDDLHKKGIIHRDLKPDNLLINQDGHLKLTDFGLSRMGLVGRHTNQPSVSTEGSDSGNGSGPLMMQSKIQGKSTSSQETTRPGSMSSTASISGPTNMLIESSISLVPGYFNYSKPNDRKPTITRTESNNSTRSEALFNGPIFSSTSKFVSADEDAVSSGSSDTGAGLGNNSVKNFPLFDPGDTSRKFVGTPDYLAPETIRGDGQDEMSDWWSIGCILFEFLYGYPPFHAGTPELVFDNILKRNIQWPSFSETSDAEAPAISEEAKDLIEKLLCMDQEKRIGHEGGADEIRAHPFFEGINWNTLWSDEASFIPVVDDPESTDYFDSRGAEAQALPEDIIPLEEDNEKSDDSDDGSYSGRSSRTDSLDSVGPVGSVATRKTAKLPLHIPPHIRENRSRRPSESITDDFGNFSFKNLPMLSKANKDTVTRIRGESIEHRNSSDLTKRARGLSISTNSALKCSEPSSVGTIRHPSPVHSSSQASVLSSSCISPITTNASNASSISSGSSGPPSSSSGISSPHRKVLSSVKPRGSVSLSTMSTSPLSIECPKPTKFDSVSFGSSSPNQHLSSFISSADMYLPLPISSKNQAPCSPQGLGFRRLSNMESSPELGEQFRRQSISYKYPKVFDPSPSNSDSEDAKNGSSSFKRRKAAKKPSPFSFLSPAYRPLIVLVCENNPVWRYSIETLLKGFGCRFITVNDTEEAIRYGTGDVKFDIIFTELKFPKTNGADVAKIIHSTSSPNTETPVVCVTNYAPEASNVAKSHFASIIAKPLTRDKLCDVLSHQCYWRPKEDKPYKRKGSQDSNRKKSTDEHERQKGNTNSNGLRKNLVL